MTPPGNEALQLLMERERADRDAAALALRQAQAHAERVAQQVLQFEQHRAAYAQRWQSEFNHSGGIEIVLCYRNFLQRLDQALAQLRVQATQSQAAVARSQMLLVDVERRVAAIEKLLARRAEQHRMRLGRQEQKLTDEAAQRSAWHPAAAALGTALT